MPARYQGGNIPEVRRAAIRLLHKVNATQVLEFRKIARGKDTMHTRCGPGFLYVIDPEFGMSVVRAQEICM